MKENNPLRVLRGGCWILIGEDARSAQRDHLFPDDRDRYDGFRLARDKKKRERK